MQLTKRQNDPPASPAPEWAHAPRSEAGLASKPSVDPRPGWPTPNGSHQVGQLDPTTA